MWRTSVGDRILTGIEADIFKMALSDLTSMLSDSKGEYETGITVFDCLTFGQRICVLWNVANAMLDNNVPTPKHTAINEGAIAAVFQELQDMIETEIDIDSDNPGSNTDIRQSVRKCCWELDLEVDIPPRSAAEGDCWTFCTLALRDRILWDEDFADEEHYVDANPEKASMMYSFMRVPTDYFSSVPTDPSDEETSLIIDKISNICK